MYCLKKQIAFLRKVTLFKFRKHFKYNLADNRLKLLNDNMENARAVELIDIILNSILMNRRKIGLNYI